jgi:DNA repair exonuclease SbcCD ATPase subunit
VLPQGGFASFLRSKAAERRKRLNELLRLQVYERMRELAGQRDKGERELLQHKETLLARDFVNVEPAALDCLRTRYEECKAGAGAAEEATRQARDHWMQAQQDRKDTAELAEREQALAAARRRQPEIDACCQRIDMAQRATAALPILEHTVRAREDLTKRQHAAQQAQAAAQDHRVVLDQAEAELLRARTEAEAVPGLREHLLKLAEAVARSAERERLARQLGEQKQAIAAKETQRRDTHAAAGKLQTRSTELDELLERQGTLLAQLGYDRELDLLGRRAG